VEESEICEVLSDYRPNRMWNMALMWAVTYWSHCLWLIYQQLRIQRFNLGGFRSLGDPILGTGMHVQRPGVFFSTILLIGSSVWYQKSRKLTNIVMALCNNSRRSFERLKSHFKSIVSTTLHRTDHPSAIVAPPFERELTTENNHCEPRSFWLRIVLLAWPVDLDIYLTSTF
jgi:hypothetical protein